MSCEKIPFRAMGWQPGAHPLERKKVAEGATLLSFEVGFADPHWCEHGHVGLVLEGRLAFDLDDGSLEVTDGEAFVIDPGTRHRAHNPGDSPVILFITAR